MDLLNNPYSSRRSVTVARRGIVATSQPLAVQAGISMLQQGGNAVDAALATAIALTVVEPTSNGIGADAFALVWDGTRLHGLNGSGRAAEYSFSVGKPSIFSLRARAGNRAAFIRAM